MMKPIRSRVYNMPRLEDPILEVPEIGKEFVGKRSTRQLFLMRSALAALNLSSNLAILQAAIRHRIAPSEIFPTIQDYPENWKRFQLEAIRKSIELGLSAQGAKREKTASDEQPSDRQVIFRRKKARD